MARRFASAAIVVLVLCLPRPAAAEWQFKPFIGVTYSGSSTFIDVEQNQAAEHPHLAFGGNASFLSEIFGLEADFGHTPSFFQRGDQPISNSVPSVANSGVTTFTGNVLVAMPRRLAEYTLRPYIVGGAGMMHITLDDSAGLIQISQNFKAMDLGGGVTGFLTRRVGVSWDVRYFRTIDRTTENPFSFNNERLSFWRANIAVAIRL